MESEATVQPIRPTPEQVGQDFDRILKSRPSDVVLTLRAMTDKVHQGLPEAASGEFFCTRLKW